MIFPTTYYSYKSVRLKKIKKSIIYNLSVLNLICRNYQLFKLAIFGQPIDIDHWKNDKMSPFQSYIGIVDPTDRKRFYQNCYEDGWTYNIIMSGDSGKLNFTIQDII